MPGPTQVITGLQLYQQGLANGNLPFSMTDKLRSARAAAQRAGGEFTPQGLADLQEAVRAFRVSDHRAAFQFEVQQYKDSPRGQAQHAAKMGQEVEAGATDVSYDAVSVAVEAALNVSEVRDLLAQTVEEGGEPRAKVVALQNAHQAYESAADADKPAAGEKLQAAAKTALETDGTRIDQTTGAGSETAPGNRLKAAADKVAADTTERNKQLSAAQKLKVQGMDIRFQQAQESGGKLVDQAAKLKAAGSKHEVISTAAQIELLLEQLGNPSPDEDPQAMADREAKLQSLESKMKDASEGMTDAQAGASVIDAVNRKQAKTAGVVMTGKDSGYVAWNAVTADQLQRLGNIIGWYKQWKNKPTNADFRKTLNEMQTMYGGELASGGSDAGHQIIGYPDPDKPGMVQMCKVTDAQFEKLNEARSKPGDRLTTLAELQKHLGLVPAIGEGQANSVKGDVSAKVANMAFLAHYQERTGVGLKKDQQPSREYRNTSFEISPAENPVLDPDAAIEQANAQGSGADTAVGAAGAASGSGGAAGDGAGLAAGGPSARQAAPPPVPGGPPHPGLVQGSGVSTDSPAQEVGMTNG